MKSIVLSDDSKSAVVSVHMVLELNLFGEKSSALVLVSFFALFSLTEDKKSLIGRNPQKVGYCRLSSQLLMKNVRHMAEGDRLRVA